MRSECKAYLVNFSNGQTNKQNRNKKEYISRKDTQLNGVELLFNWQGQACANKHPNIFCFYSAGVISDFSSFEKISISISRCFVNFSHNDKI